MLHFQGFKIVRHEFLCQQHLLMAYAKIKMCIYINSVYRDCNV